MLKKKGALAILCALSLSLAGCASRAAELPVPAPTNTHRATQPPQSELRWPREKLQKAEGGVPTLRVYVADDKKMETVDVETYVQGVLAGEMKNDWPLEALKAQAILARTFVLKFIEEKTSKYEGADISTDIEEAQAYDKSAVNDRIRQAVNETKGLVLSANGTLPYAWFHAHSGGVTELAKAGLGWEKDEPDYTQVVKSNEPETVQNEKDAQTLKDAQSWTATFPFAEFEAACAKQGAKATLTNGTPITIEQRGESGRAVTLKVGDQSVNASELRIALGSTKIRSTLITSLKAEGGKVIVSGKGYGHGVGMSQWGAYGMAQQGANAEEIVKHYFKGVTVEKIW